VYHTCRTHTEGGIRNTGWKGRVLIDDACMFVRHTELVLA
jgi:hypothetical protein